MLFLGIFNLQNILGLKKDIKSLKEEFPIDWKIILKLFDKSDNIYYIDYLEVYGQKSRGIGSFILTEFIKAVKINGNSSIFLCAEPFGKETYNWKQEYRTKLNSFYSKHGGKEFYGFFIWNL